MGAIFCLAFDFLHRQDPFFYNQEILEGLWSTIRNSVDMGLPVYPSPLKYQAFIYGMIRTRDMRPTRTLRLAFLPLDQNLGGMSGSSFNIHCWITSTTPS